MDGIDLGLLCGGQLLVGRTVPLDGDAQVGGPMSSAARTSAGTAALRTLMDVAIEAATATAIMATMSR